MEDGVKIIRKLNSDSWKFVVEDYSVRKLGVGVGKAMELGLEDCVVGMQKWCIRFFPEGVDDAAHNEGYASLYLGLRKSASAKPVEYLISIHIVDQSGGGKDCGYSSFRNKQVERLTCSHMTGDDKFIRRAELDSPDSPYVKGDCLKIRLRIGVFTYQHESYFDMLFKRLRRDEHISMRQWQWHWHDEFIFFQAGAQGKGKGKIKTYCAAKSIIAARCPLLLIDAGLDVVVIPEVESRIFKVVLLFIYYETIEKNDIDDSDPQDLESFAAKLLAASDRFQIQGLKKICEESISNKVCRESLASLLNQARLCNAAQLGMEKGETKMVRKIEIETRDFVVENYSVRKLGVGVGKEMELAGLEEIVVAGHRFGISFFPEGVNDAAHNEGYASLYLTLKSAEPVEFLTTLYIIDQSGKGGHLCGASSFYLNHIQRSRMSGNSYFIRRAQLDSPDSPYVNVKEDSLKICVWVGVFTYHQQQPQEEEEEEKLCDPWLDEYIFFDVADETFCGAKSKIAARCPLLLSHLPDVCQRQDVIIPDVDHRVFMCVLSFIYNRLGETYQKVIDDSDPQDVESFAIKLLGAADRFEIQGLKKICEESISDKVCRESVFPLLNLARVYNAAQLKSVCLRFAAQNPSVLESDECEVLEETCPLLFQELNDYKDYSSFKDNNPKTTTKGVLNTYIDKIISFLIGRQLKIKKL